MKRTLLATAMIVSCTTPPGRVEGDVYTVGLDGRARPAAGVLIGLVSSDTADVILSQWCDRYARAKDSLDAVVDRAATAVAAITMELSQLTQQLATAPRLNEAREAVFREWRNARGAVGDSLWQIAVAMPRINPDLERWTGRRQVLADSLIAIRAGVNDAGYDSLLHAFLNSLTDALFAAGDTIGSGMAAHYAFDSVAEGDYSLWAYSWNHGVFWKADVTIEAPDTLRRDLDDTVAEPLDQMCS